MPPPATHTRVLFPASYSNVTVSLSLAHQVVEGMDVVKQVEALGSQSGAPQAKIQIVKSGEIAL